MVSFDFISLISLHHDFLMTLKHERRKHIVSASQVVLKELTFPGDLNFAAPHTHEFLRFQGDLISRMGILQNFLKFYRFW